MNRDVIKVKGISSRGFHGVHAWEQEQGQLFTVDISLTVDTEKAGRSDDLTDTVNYSVLAREVAAVVAGEPCQLLETLAQRIAETVLQSPLVSDATVTVHKPEAQCAVEASDVSVTITRDRAWLDTRSVTSTTIREENSAPPTHPAEKKPTVEPSTPVLGIPEISEPVETDTEEDAETVIFDAPYVIALGANTGDPTRQLRTAVEAFVDHPEIEVQAVSPLVRTPAQLKPDQEPQPDYSNAIVILTTGLPLGEFFDFTQGLERAAGRHMGEEWQPRPLDIDIVAIGDYQLRSDRLTIPHARAASRIFVLGPWAMIDQDAELVGAGQVAELADALPQRDDIISFEPDWLTDDDPTASPTASTAESLAPQHEVSAGPQVPQRRSIRDRMASFSPLPSDAATQNDSFAEQEPVSDIAADPRVARTTTTMRRVVVRPTTTGTFPILPADTHEQVAPDADVEHEDSHRDGS